LREEARYRLSIDIGGTFTDLVLVNEVTGEVSVVKVLSTPKDPSIGAFIGMRRILSESGARADQLSAVIHATTVVTNTVIERKGAKTGFIATKGFKDLLEIGRERRVTQYDLFEERLPPLVPRYLRREVNERLAPNGEVIKELNVDEVKSVLGELVKLGVESIAVTLLHSYANPKHELLIKSVAEKEFPQLSVSISSEVLPEWREYERASTTTVNAYTQPVTKRYIRGIEQGLIEYGCKGKLFIMSASGGLMAADTAAKYPMRILESGPAAVALAGAFIGRIIGEENLISFDMGGTTAKSCLIERGEPRITTVFEVGGYRFKKGSGYPVKVPTIDLIEIGAGGGSIAHVEMGLLKVGPESAGADPGPACYARGGDKPTVTDADLVLGYLNPDYFLGGEMKLSVDLAVKAIEEHVAKPLNMSIVEAARGIYDVVNANMALAMRAVSVERGRDPSTLTLIAFGGAGPLHANRLAQQLKIRKIVIPPLAGLTSALGLLAADVKFDTVRTYVSRLEDVDVNVVEKMYKEMEVEAVELVKAAGVTDIELIRSVDMRYMGQAYELNVPLVGSTLDQAIKGLAKLFTEAYRQSYGYTMDDPVETVNWRLLAIGRVPRVKLKKVEKTVREAFKGKRKAYFAEYNDYVDCKVYDRYKLYPGIEVEGPAIIEEKESTIVVCPGYEVTLDEYGNVVITLKR